MEYYGNNDWRDYLRRQNELKHFGIPKKSGRYPWGSGKDPYHHGADVPGVARKKRLHNFTGIDKSRVKGAFKREGVIGGLYEISTIKREAKEQPEYKADAEKKIKFYADYLNKNLWNNEKALKKATRLAAELEAREIADTEGRNYNKVLEKTLQEYQNTSDDRVRGKIESAYDEIDGYARNIGFEAFQALTRYQSTQDTLSKVASVEEWHKDLKKQIYESRSGDKLSDVASKIYKEDKSKGDPLTESEKKLLEDRQYFRGSGGYDNYEKYLDDYVSLYDKKQEKEAISKDDVMFDPSDFKEVKRILNESNNRVLTDEERNKLNTVVLDQLGSWESEGLSKRDFELKKKVLNVIDSDESKRFNQALSNRLSEAKNKDRYDLDFIEAIQNKQILEDGHETERLKAYEEYLRDPEDFWKNKLDKYKDA